MAAGINKYSWVTANRGYYDHIHLKYSGEERVTRVQDIQHNIFREALRMVHQTDPIELVSSSDVPAGCGLGSSGSFTVALVCALLAYKQTVYPFTPFKHGIAEMACRIEIEKLKEPIGKQDQYIAAYGGVTGFTFNADGTVTVRLLDLTPETVRRLNDNLVLIYTNIPRKASDVLSEQVKEMEAGGEVLNRLDKIRGMALETRKLLEAGKLDEWGELLNSYWETRKSISTKISNPQIDEAYHEAKKCGALGGKLQGAGGGGFLMFYCPKNKERLKEKMVKLSMKPMDFEFDYEGVKYWRCA